MINLFPDHDIVFGTSGVPEKVQQFSVRGRFDFCYIVFPIIIWYIIILYIIQCIKSLGVFMVTLFPGVNNNNNNTAS